MSGGGWFVFQEIGSEIGKNKVFCQGSSLVLSSKAGVGYFTYFGRKSLYI